MSLDRRIGFAVSVSWLGRLVAIVLGMVLIPVLFRHLGQEELGLWFMLGQSAGFLGLMDLGVAPTLTRRIAFAKAKSGADPGVSLSPESRQEIADLVATGRVIYRFLALAVFLVAWTSGFFFIGQIQLNELDYQTVSIAWTAMCLSHAVAVWATMWSCLLQGTGHVGWDGVISIIILVLTILVQIAVVLLGGGLIALAVVATAGALLTRFATLGFMRWKQPELFRLNGRWDENRFRSMISPASKAWITALGAFLILRTDQFFIAYFRGAEDIPPYHAAYQLVSNLYMLAIAFAVASGVFVSQLWQAGELAQIHRLVQRNLRFTLIMMACGIACLMLVGRELTNLWLGPGHFIGYPILAVFCAMLFLEAQHVSVAAASRATGDEAFALWALAAGLLNFLFTWLLIGPFGLLGVALGTMLAQLLTNNWYVLYRGLWRLRMSRREYLRRISVPVGGVFILALGLGALALTALPDDAGNATVLVTGLVTCGLVWCSAVWGIVLTPEQRRRVLVVIPRYSPLWSSK